MAKLISKLKIIAVGADKAAALTLEDTADFILNLIRLYAPIATGALRDSYRIESVGLLHIIIGSMLNYSIFVELGTSKSNPQPHLLPAFAEAESFFRQAFIKRLKDLE